MGNYYFLLAAFRRVVFFAAGLRLGAAFLVFRLAVLLLAAVLRLAGLRVAFAFRAGLRFAAALLFVAIILF